MKGQRHMRIRSVVMRETAVTHASCHASEHACLLTA